MTRTAIVIGAGITGVAAAEWLRRSGVAVTLVDRAAPGGTHQASYGNAGLLARAAVVPVAEPGVIWKAPRMVFDPDFPLFLRWRHLGRLLPWLLPFVANSRAAKMEETARVLATLTADSVDQHRALAAGTGAENLIRTGDYAFYYRDRKGFEKDRAGMALRARLGFAHTEISGEALRARDPALSDAYCFAAVFGDHGWLTSPGDYVATLARHYVQSGGTFREAEVVDAAPGSVTLGGGETLRAERIVLTAGAWSAPLARKLGQRRPLLETERGYHLMLRGANVTPPHPFMISDAKCVVTPMRDGLRCAGIVELGGLSAPPSTAPLALLRKRIREVYPALLWESEESWMGHRPSTPDSLPHLGPLAGAPGVVVAYGGQHVGLTIGPRLGRMAADLAMGRAVDMDLAPFDPRRFS